MRRQLAARLLLLLPLLATDVAAVSDPQIIGAEQYGRSEHNPDWQLGPISKLLCWLEQEIPNYGRARFHKMAGGELILSIYPIRQPSNSGHGRLLVVPPVWRHDRGRRDYGAVAWQPGAEAFRIPAALTQQLLQSLQQGMEVAISYPDWYGSGVQIGVRLSPLGVRQPLQDFSRCIAEVVPYSWEQIHDNMFYFEPYKSELTDAHRDLLKGIATYVEADPAVVMIRVDSHTDTTGRRRMNQELSEQRLAAVKEQLLAFGVNPALIVAEAHGESRPVESNRTRRGRDLNRRVHVVVSKEVLEQEPGVKIPEDDYVPFQLQQLRQRDPEAAATAEALLRGQRDERGDDASGGASGTTPASAATTGGDAEGSSAAITEGEGGVTGAAAAPADDSTPVPPAMNGSVVPGAPGMAGPAGVIGGGR